MIRITALVLIYASVACAVFVDFKPCDNTKPTPQLVQIDACPSHECTMKRGVPTYVYVSFVSPVEADQVFNMTGQSACGHGIVCPLSKGGICMYNSFWTPTVSDGSSMTQFSLFDGKKNTLVCFEMPISQ